MLKRFIISSLLIFTSLAIPTTLTSQVFDQEPVKAEIVYDETSIQPDQPFWVGIHLTIDKGWHAYWKNPGAAGMPPEINWTLPEGFTVDTIEWPTPTKFTLNEEIGYGYENHVTLLTKISPPKNLPKELNIQADISWVVCDDGNCLPGGQEVQVTLPTDTKLPNNHAPLISKTKETLPKQYLPLHGEKNNGLITFTIESETPFTHAQFFPEESDKIDEQTDPVISRSKESPQQLQIILTNKDGADHCQPLKGILALYDNKEAKTPAASYSITAAIQGSQCDTALAYADTYATGSHDDNANQSLWIALVFAFIGGLILNLMPCVLPVISFKVLSFVKMAGQSRSLVFKHGVVFSAGVLISFWTLAGVMLTLQSYGESIGWGFQLQNPLFVAVLAALIFIFGLSMFGLFEIGTGIATAAGQAAHSTKSEGLSSSFFSGILATAVATPCTGPFLGTTVGLAVTLPTIQAMLLFSMIGIGMAFPYLLLGAFPALLRFMPKPGNWMITFKEILGFIMMVTVLWLTWVFSDLTDSFATILLLFAFLVMSLGCWIYGKWASPVRKKRTRLIGTFAAIALLAFGGYTMVQATSISSQDDWETFSPERVAELRKQGTPVFIDYTAKWCLVCQANHFVLSQDSVNQKFKNKKVVKMKADWTKKDPIITEALRKLGRNSVPVYVLYGKDSDNDPVILPQVLTPDTVIDELDKV